MNIAAGPAAGYDVDSDPVAPHGIIGQTYDRDNIAVDGKHDDYHADVVYTSAMAEGAIEGKAADYKLAGKFDTNFKFSVFSASKAAPRDVTKLSGTQRYVGSGKPQRTGAFSDGVNLEMVLVEEDGIDGRRLDDCIISTSVPTSSPTDTPTATPTSSPTSDPTSSPTDTPTATPTSSPTSDPTSSPTSGPTSSPTSEPPACQNSNLATNNPTKWYDAAQVDVLLSRAMDLPPCERCPGQIPTPCERCPPLVAYHPPMETVESPHLGTTATVFGQGEGVGTWEWDIRRHKNIRYIMWRAHNPHLEPTCTPPA